jgi:hypothetical protein
VTEVQPPAVRPVAAVWRRIAPTPVDAVVLLGHGHPSIRATHSKTLELTADPVIGLAATCVVATGVALAAPDGNRERAWLAGPVHIELTVGRGDADGRDESGWPSVCMAALANPDWEPGGTAVLRRGPARLASTMATHADVAAADLPRELVGLLAESRTTVRLAVTSAPASGRPDGRGQLVLLRWPNALVSHRRLVAELAAADVVVAEDTWALRALARHVPATGFGPPAPAGPAELRVGAAERVLVVAAGGLPGGSVRQRLAVPAGWAVETAGLTAEEAVAAVSPARGAVQLAGVVGPTELAMLLEARLPAGLVVGVDTSLLPRALRYAHRAGLRTGSFAATELTVPAWWGSLDAAPLTELARGCAGNPVWCCFDAPPERLAGVDPGPLIALLRAAGVPAKTVAKALSAVVGLDRRELYRRASAAGQPPPDSPSG